MRLLRTRWASVGSGLMVEAHRLAICDWLRVHGVDPDEVWSIEVRGRRIYLVEFRRNDQGHRYVEHDEVATRTRWVRLRQEPPVLKLPG